MYMGISELKTIKGAIKHVTCIVDMFCKIIRHKIDDIMSKTLKAILND